MQHTLITAINFCFRYFTIRSYPKSNPALSRPIPSSREITTASYPIFYLISYCHQHYHVHPGTFFRSATRSAESTTRFRRSSCGALQYIIHDRDVRVCLYFPPTVGQSSRMRMCASSCQARTIAWKGNKNVKPGIGLEFYQRLAFNTYLHRGMTEGRVNE